MIRDIESEKDAMNACWDVADGFGGGGWCGWCDHAAVSGAVVTVTYSRRGGAGPHARAAPGKVGTLPRRVRRSAPVSVWVNPETSRWKGQGCPHARTCYTKMGGAAQRGAPTGGDSSRSQRHNSAADGSVATVIWVRLRKASVTIMPSRMALMRASTGVTGGRQVEGGPPSGGPRYFCLATAAEPPVPALLVVLGSIVEPYPNVCAAPRVR